MRTRSAYIPSEERRPRRKAAWQPLFAAAAAQGYTRSWLAAQVGISRQVLHSYEQGICRVPEDVMTRLCALVRFPPEALATDPPELYYLVKKRPGKRYRRLPPASTPAISKPQATSERQTPTTAEESDPDEHSTDHEPDHHERRAASHDDYPIQPSAGRAPARRDRGAHGAALAPGASGARAGGEEPARL